MRINSLKFKFDLYILDICPQQIPTYLDNGTRKHNPISRESDEISYNTYVKPDLTGDLKEFFERQAAKEKRFWSDRLSFTPGEPQTVTASSGSELRNNFDNLQNILDEIEKASPRPLSLDTAVSFKITFGDENSVTGERQFSGKVPLWQMPGRIFDIRRDMNLDSQDSAPKFRIAFEKIDDQSPYRVYKTGNNLQDLISALRYSDEIPAEDKKNHPELIERQKQSHPSDWNHPEAMDLDTDYRGINGLPHYRITIHNYADPDPLFVQTEIKQDFTMLIRDISRISASDPAVASKLGVRSSPLSETAYTSSNQNLSDKRPPMRPGF